MVESCYKKLNPHLAKITTKFTQKYIDKNFVEPTVIGNETSAYL
jgi:hypothetical protein